MRSLLALLVAALVAGCTLPGSPPERDAAAEAGEPCGRVGVEVEPRSQRVGDVVEIRVRFENCGGVTLHQPGPGCYREERLPAFAHNGTVLALGFDPERPRTASPLSLPGSCFALELPEWSLAPGEVEETRIEWNGTLLEWRCQESGGICGPHVVAVGEGGFALGATRATQHGTFEAPRVRMAWTDE